jgi:hypothetical protein
MSNPNDVLNIVHNGDALLFNAVNCYEGQADSTAWLMSEAYKQLKEKGTLLPVFRATFHLGDAGNGVNPYSFAIKEYNQDAIPDFVFHEWREAGVNNYDETCNKMIENSSLPHEEDVAFWIGNTQCHHTRKQLVEMRNDNILAINCGSWAGVTGQLKKPQYAYVPHTQHYKFRYLIDIQGYGISGRAKILFFSGRPLFYVDRPWHEFWFFDMKPFEHYIPVKEDLSDLLDKIQWARKNDEKAKQIATTAQEYAKANMRTQNAIDRYKKILIKIGAKL